MRICETFLSLQGESTFSGLPCFFIRTAGCNLNCTYCDTPYAKEGGREMSIQEIIQSIPEKVNIITITGGEPLLQTETKALISALQHRKKIVLLETNGSLPVNSVPKRVIRIVDVKTPGSGEQDTFLTKNLKYLTPDDELKFVLTSKEDYLWALEKLREWNLYNVKVLFSPAWGYLNPRDLWEWMTQDCPPARLQLQLHKIVWGNRRGI